MVKQVILFREDLHMRKGKIAAQAAHASMKVFFDRGGVSIAPSANQENPGAGHEKALHVPLTDEMAEWVQGIFTKIVLSVADEETLLQAHTLALAAGLPTSLVTDVGATEFHGVATHTAVAIGPAEAGRIDLITGPNGTVKTRLA